VSISAVVAHARDVPSDVREALGDVLADLPVAPDRFLVRTCHRVELYAIGADAAELADIEIPPGVTRLEDVDAVRHLIAVACGLDSAVFGETQILHQLREALESRRGDAALDPALDRLFQAALRAGREARTYVTGPPRSLADAALDRIDGGSPASARGLAGREILVVGAGRMGRLAALAAARRGARVRVASRHRFRAESLATELGGTAPGFDEPLGEVPAGVIVALAGGWPISDEDVARLVEARSVLVDLSSPPALGVEHRAAIGDRHVSVDDLAAQGDDGPDARLRLRLERLTSRAGADYCQWLRSRASVPAIAAVVNHAEARRVEELATLRLRLPDLTDAELAAVEQMTHRLVASLLHAPLTALSSDDDGELEPAARTLFGI